MKGLIAVGVSLLIAIHTTSATIDVKKLKESATPLLQTLTDEASTQIHTLKDTASMNIQTLKDTASMNLQTLKQQAATTLKQLQENAKTNLNEFVQSIDLDKLKKLDILNIGSKVHKKIALVKRFPTHADKIKFILNGGKGITKLKGKDFWLAFDGEYPWPVVRRRIEYIYE